MTISRSGSLGVITKYICERNAFVSLGPKIRQRLRKLFILAKTREKKYNGILVAADSQQVIAKFQSSVIGKVQYQERILS